LFHSTPHSNDVKFKIAQRVPEIPNINATKNTVGLDIFVNRPKHSINTDDNINMADTISNFIISTHLLQSPLSIISHTIANVRIRIKNPQNATFIPLPKRSSPALDVEHIAISIPIAINELPRITDPWKIYICNFVRVILYSPPSASYIQDHMTRRDRLSAYPSHSRCIILGALSVHGNMGIYALYTLLKYINPHVEQHLLNAPCGKWFMALQYGQVIIFSGI
jgi:hypothetical protein